MLFAFHMHAKNRSVICLRENFTVLNMLSKQILFFVQVTLKNNLKYFPKTTIAYFCCFLSTGLLAFFFVLKNPVIVAANCIFLTKTMFILVISCDYEIFEQNNFALLK